MAFSIQNTSSMTVETALRTFKNKLSAEFLDLQEQLQNIFDKA
jgi:hypothetical protein